MATVLVWTPTACVSVLMAVGADSVSSPAAVEDRYTNAPAVPLRATLPTLIADTAPFAAVAAELIKNSAGKYAAATPEAGENLYPGVVSEVKYPEM